MNYVLKISLKTEKLQWAGDETWEVKDPLYIIIRGNSGCNFRETNNKFHETFPSLVGERSRDYAECSQRDDRLMSICHTHTHERERERCAPCGYVLTTVSRDDRDVSITLVVI